jgi:uncharacterized membrane protein SirB2
MEAYSALKLLHVSCAVLSISGFFYRWSLHLKRSPLLNSSAIKMLPHLIDTVLLGSAIALIIMGPFDLGSEHWLLAKILLVIGYILFGLKAFRGKDMQARQKAFTGATICVALILMFAVEHLARVNHWNVLSNGATVNVVEEFDHSKQP